MLRGGSRHHSPPGAAPAGRREAPLGDSLWGAAKMQAITSKCELSSLPRKPTPEPSTEPPRPQTAVNRRQLFGIWSLPFQPLAALSRAVSKVVLAPHHPSLLQIP